MNLSVKTPAVQAKNTYCVLKYLLFFAYSVLPTKVFVDIFFLPV